MSMSQAEVGLTSRTDARHQLVLLALFPVLDCMTAILENLLLLVFLRATLVYVGGYCKVRHSTSCYGYWGGAERTDWHLQR